MLYLASARRQFCHGLLFARLLPDAHKFGLHESALTSGNGIQHIALLVHQTALTRRSRKQLPDRGQQSVMPIGHDQIDVAGSSCAQVLQQASPSLLVLLSTGAQGSHLFVAFLIHP